MNYGKALHTFLIILAFIALAGPVLADGLVRPPLNYKGSLAEKSQEAIIVFTPGTETRSAKQDLILKIQVAGSVSNFAWVVPLPKVPKTAKADAGLFRECFDYVQARQRPAPKRSVKGMFGASKSAAGGVNRVEVVKREVVGSYDIAIVREKVAGSLNDWLRKEGYQAIEGGEAVVEHYRAKDYVFACMKVTDVAIKDGRADLHPLRFSFETGGRDGIYFPMKLTGLQEGAFDVNLYVFLGSWINDHINGYGFEHRGFKLVHRDWDTAKCKPNAGKTWSLPERDVYLRDQAHRIPKLKQLFQARYPGERFYLTNIRATRLDPERVRDWKDDLWLYPYYTQRDFVPFDAR